jgi:hypothetical protein
LTPTRPDREDSNSETSSQTIALKARADSPDHLVIMEASWACKIRVLT